MSERMIGQMDGRKYEPHNGREKDKWKGDKSQGNPTKSNSRRRGHNIVEIRRLLARQIVGTRATQKFTTLVCHRIRPSVPNLITSIQYNSLINKFLKNTHSSTPPPPIVNKTPRGSFLPSFPSYHITESGADRQPGTPFYHAVHSHITPRQQPTRPSIHSVPVTFTKLSPTIPQITD